MKKITCEINRSNLKEQFTSSTKRTMAKSKEVLNKKAQIESLCALLTEFYNVSNNSN